jgi:hypothetical protein
MLKGVAIEGSSLNEGALVVSDTSEEVRLPHPVSAKITNKPIVAKRLISLSLFD